MPTMAAQVPRVMNAFRIASAGRARHTLSNKPMNIRLSINAALMAYAKIVIISPEVRKLM